VVVGEESNVSITIEAQAVMFMFVDGVSSFKYFIIVLVCDLMSFGVHLVDEV
jgi:hypothetical protein